MLRFSFRYPPCWLSSFQHSHYFSRIHDSFLQDTTFFYSLMLTIFTFLYMSNNQLHVFFIWLLQTKLPSFLQYLPKQELKTRGTDISTHWHPWVDQVWPETSNSFRFIWFALIQFFATHCNTYCTGLFTLQLFVTSLFLHLNCPNIIMTIFTIDLEKSSQT
jgi:hypothetical protein